MIYAIVKNLFEIKKKNKCMTFVTDRKLSDNFFIIKKSENIKKDKTSLSKYFSDREGLNTMERLRFNYIVTNAHNQR